jgi:hypothetical protein
MTTRRKASLVALPLLAIAAWYYVVGHATPAGQPQLHTLVPNTFEALKATFNQKSGTVRVVAFLSPT